MENKPNTGVIFKNDYKKEGDKLPTYKGKGNFNGADFEIALWVNKDKEGKSYFGATFSEPYVKPEVQEQSPTFDNKGNAVDDDSLPF